MPFQIKSDKKATKNKTIRFPVDLMEKINTVLDEYNVTFSGFIIQACEYALENMESTQDISQEVNKR